MEERETMKKNLLAYSIILLSLYCFVDLSLGWSSFIFIALAVLLFFQQRGEGMPLPPVSLLLLANVLGYPVIVLMPWLYRDLWARLNPYIIELAMLWALRGFAAFCCAYLLGDAFARYLHRRQTHHGWNDGERVAYIRYAVHAMGILSIIAWAIKSYHFGFGLTFIDSRTMLDVNSSGSSVSMTLDQLIYLRDPFLFFFGVMYARRLHSRFMWLLFAGIAVGLLFEIVTIGSKGAIIRLLFIVALVIAFTTRRISLKQLLAGGLMLFTVYMAFAIITEYRDILGEKKIRGEDVFDVSVQVDAFAEALMVSLPFTEKVEQRRTTVNEEGIFGRISSGIFSFGYLLYYTGGRSPHEHAWEVFLLPVYSVVPRSLVEKPIFFNSARFGLEYFHSSTAIAISTVGSFYYAWGYGGILIGMGLFGGALAFFIQRVRLRGTALTSVVFMMAIMMRLVDVGFTFWGVGIELCRLALIMLGLYMLYPIVKRLKSGRAPMVAMAAPSGHRAGGDYEPF